MFEFLIAKLGGGLIAQSITYGTSGIALIILLWIIKKIPKGKIKTKWGVVCYTFGVAITLGGSQWFKKFGKNGVKFYQAIEDYLLDFIEDVFFFGLAEILRGARSDNLTLKESIKKQNTFTTKNGGKATTGNG